MIIVNLKPTRYRSSQLPQDASVFYVTGIANWHITGKPHVWHPPTDVYETEEKVVIRVEIAGMRDGDVSVNFDHHILSITGSRSEVPEKRAFNQMEIFFGEFSSEIEIPVPIDVDNIQAEYEDGFLRVYLPKATPRHIEISEE